jgi:hypothetical protein
MLTKALQIGLISQIVHGTTVDALLHHAVHLCHSVTIHSPVAVLGTKKALLYARDHTVADSLSQISSFNALALQSDDSTLAIQAAKEKKHATIPSMPTYPRLWSQCTCRTCYSINEILISRNISPSVCEWTRMLLGTRELATTNDKYGNHFITLPPWRTLASAKLTGIVASQPAT